MYTQPTEYNVSSQI